MATPHNDSHQSHLNFMYFPIFNKRTSRHSEDPKTADLRNYLEELYRLPPPIGLKLKEPWKLAALIEKRLRESKSKRMSKSTALVDRVEKSKSDHFPFSLLKIGAFEVAGMWEADLVAKCYYRRRKLVWEILHNGLKNKIEISWRNILSMRTRVQENGIGILDLELNKPPSFFHEIDRKPRRQTLWRPSSDFTRGQASIYRRHYLEFPPGIVEKHLEKLVSDEPLLQLSRKRFPCLACPYFNPNITYGDNAHQPNSSQPIPPSQQFPVIPYVNELPSLPFYQSSSPTSVEDSFQDPILAFFEQELGGFADSSESHPMLDDPRGAELQDTSSNYNNVHDNNQMLSNWSLDIACENRHVKDSMIPCANTTSSGIQNDLYISQSESELRTVNIASNANVNEESIIVSSQRSRYYFALQNEIWNHCTEDNGSLDPSMHDKSSGSSSNNDRIDHQG